MCYVKYCVYSWMVDIYIYIYILYICRKIEGAKRRVRLVAAAVDARSQTGCGKQARSRWVD